MTIRLRRSIGIWLATVGAIGCGDVPMASETPLPPLRPGVAGELRVSVNAVTGEMTYEPVSGVSVPNGVSAQIYGDQNVNIRLYNAPPSVVTAAGVRTLTADVGVKNLRSHPIGDEQGAATPPDTMGLYIFFTSEPVVTGTSGACAGGCYVNVRNHDGTAAFDQPAQKYFYYRERIRAFGHAAGDTSMVRRPWIFDMSPEVTNFQFFVLVSAPWPAPHETRWKVSYRGNALPDTGMKPRWRTVVNGNGGTRTIVGGQLSLSGNSSHNVKYFRQDSVTTGADGYIEAIVAIPTGNSSPKAVIGIADGQRLLALGLGRGMAGMLTSSDAYITGYTVSGLSDNSHVFQLRKYADDSVVVSIDGLRRFSMPYASASSDPYVSSATPSSLQYFGTTVTGTGLSSTWTSVTYEIGSPTP